MATTVNSNIDPALQQRSPLTSPREARHAYPNPNGPSYSPVQPIQPSPNSFQGLPPTPTYYNKPSQDSPEQDASPRGDPSDPNDIKRPRACEACRGLKVKCEFDDNVNPDVCKRCTKAGRQCIVTAPSRKRQKKTDSRVAELEKKIDALTATLAAQGHSEADIHHSAAHGGLPQSRPPPYSEPWPQGHPQAHPQMYPSPQNASQGVKRKIEADHDYFGGELKRSQQAAAFKASPAPVHIPPYSREPSIKQDYEDSQWQNVDVISIGLIDEATAKRCFERYVNEMSPHLPIVVFPAGTVWDQIRRDRPILFLGVLAVASGTIRNDLQQKLLSKLTRILGDRIVHRGEKSLEIVQTIQCITTFYQPPEKYEELNFNQLIHIAAVMALDLGMGKRFKKTDMALWKGYADARSKSHDPASAETRRCWLGCYFMCCNSAMSLRRPLLVRWSNYADECINMLQSAEDAAPTDPWLCFLVRGQHIVEDIGLEFSMDDPASQVSLTDHKTQYHLKAFERQLEEWCNSATPEMKKQPIMRHMMGIINLYMHEIAMHHNHNIDDFKPPFNATPIDGPPDPDFVTPAHIESLTTCMKSVHDVFEAFLSMDVQQLRSLPTLFFVRNSYAAVALIKMYTAVSAKGSKFGSIISIEDLKVDYYLDRMVDRLANTAEGHMCKVAQKFTIIFTMLRQWHVRRTDHSNSSNPVSRQRTPLPNPASQRRASANTGPQQQQPQPYLPGHPPPMSSWTGHPQQIPPPHHGPPHGQQHSHAPQGPPRSGLQMLSDAAMNPAVPPQQQLGPHQTPPQQQPQWLPPLNTMPPPPGMPNDMLNPGGYPMNMGEFPDLDLNMMAYGFGDEFVAMGYGVGMGMGGLEGGPGQNGWNF
ncbi:uncharacterized protein AB675_3929 [Cyphellophora attinorum]|uniref:Zn(2)-C6 fungal-type domain-containing protein n=1 Tax=Cyphellophora attinorum TaxID=1664694 RepID=A0A0N1NXU5_9EURO|nr:uncharacterized protein AB675_3929 [Phialophora attinorum]KPI37583.1 hypothetical protein AB675_3929 [Phialophora attinorum]